MLLLLAGAALLAPGPGTSLAGDKPGSAATEPEIAKAWERRIPELNLNQLPLEEIVNLLRNKFPELNFMAKQKARNESVSLVLRSVTLEEILKAIEPATEGRVVVLWPTNNGDRLVIFDRASQAVPVDPSTGLPFPNSGKKICRVFSLSDYFAMNPDVDIDVSIKEIQNVLQTAWSMMREANAEDEPMPTLSVHRGTKMLVAVGRPEDLVILSQVVSELQGHAAGVPLEGKPPKWSGSPKADMPRVPSKK
jgi:hypothetical protein